MRHPFAIPLLIALTFARRIAWMPLAALGGATALALPMGSAAVCMTIMAITGAMALVALETPALASAAFIAISMVRSKRLFGMGRCRLAGAEQGAPKSHEDARPQGRLGLFCGWRLRHGSRGRCEHRYNSRLRHRLLVATVGRIRGCRRFLGGSR